MQQQETSQTPAYTVELRGMKIQCADIDAVVEVVRKLEPVERADLAPAPQATPERERITLEVSGNPLAEAVYGQFRNNASWRRPAELVRAIRALRDPKLPKKDVTYNRVYAVLRYGDFTKDGGRWNLRDNV